MMRRALVGLMVTLIVTGALPAATLAFGDGIHVVGEDIEAGIYRAEGGESCYWARLSDLGGTLDEIISDGNPAGAITVRILPTDAGFETQGCGEWLAPGVSLGQPTQSPIEPTPAPEGVVYSTLGDLLATVIVMSEDMISIADGSRNAGALRRKVTNAADNLDAALDGFTPHPCMLAGYDELRAKEGGLRLWALLLREQPRSGAMVYIDDDVLEWFLPDTATFNSDECPDELRVAD